MKKILFILAFLIILPIGIKADSYYGVPYGADNLSNLTVGQWTGRVVSYRIKAEHTGTTQDFTFYVINKIPNYAAGDGGQILIEIRTDDNGLPSDTVLGSYLWYPPMLDFYDPQNDKFPTLPLEADLVEGEIYHIKFSNIHPDPVNNFVSVDDLFIWDADISPMHPAISQEDLAVLLIRAGGWDWELKENHTPIYKLSYTDGNSQGQPYIDGKTSYFKNMDGTNMVRQTFTNNDQDRLVSDVNVRVKKISGGGDLTVRLEHSNGDVIEEGTIPEAEISTTISWLNRTFSQEYNLEEGRTYNLVLYSNGGQYTTNPIQQGDYYGLDAGGFDDGKIYYSSNAGQSWSSFPFDGDMQFYFTVEEEAVVIDNDGDGVPAEEDCNDNDATISETQTYYADTDNDGYGDPNNYIAVCSYTVPEGYVTNADDLDDNDNGIEPEITVALNGRYLHVYEDGVQVASRRIFKYRQYRTIFATADFYDDGVLEIIVSSLRKRKRGKVISLQYENNTIEQKKRKSLRFKKRKKNLSLELDVDNNEFMTTFNKREITWQIEQDGLFSR